MRFSDGYWRPQKGMRVEYPAAVRSVDLQPRGITAYAPVKRIDSRRDTLNNPVLTIQLWSPLPGVIGVKVVHHAGAVDRQPKFVLEMSTEHTVTTRLADGAAVLESGDLQARISLSDHWQLTFWSGDKLLASSEGKSIGYARSAEGTNYVHERLSIDVGESVYGFGERSTAFVKNGQSIDTWNNDGGPSSDHAYKSIPFYLSSKGYGVFVNSTDRVSFEVGSEFASRNQFSVPGERLEYFVFGGGNPKAVIERYTELTGRPALPPAWSFGLWLSTSFVTSYDAATVAQFVQGMADHDIPMSVYHFDTFWMKEFHWSDFAWDKDAFPDPEGMLADLHERGLRTCVWINPYVAQQSTLFVEGMERGYFVMRADGSVWQTDVWQAGMAIIDVTNPDAREWFASKLRGLLDVGVDCFKTDFGEQIPDGAVFYNGEAASGMHNYYSYLYNELVFNTIRRAKGDADALVFARSATVGGQRFPVHWGGDPEPTYISMAESLRAGLSLGLAGFGFWSHDIGGFEGSPSPELFMRWAAFGLLSSHSRLHGSIGYRAPWLFGDTATRAVAHFTRLKMRLMPYIYASAVYASKTGVPVLRAMMLEFADDPNCTYLDRQYILGDSLLIAPVFTDDGRVTFYLPDGVWTEYTTGASVAGGQWITQVHGFDSMPMLVRPGSVIPVGTTDDRPDYDYTTDLVIEVYHPLDGSRVEIEIPSPGADRGRQFTVSRSGAQLRITAGAGGAWKALLVGIAGARAASPAETAKTARGILVTPPDGAIEVAIDLTMD